MINLIPAPVVDDHVIITTMIMATIVTTMVIPVIATVYTNCHNGCKSKPGRVVSIVIRRIIGHIGR